MTLEIRGWTVGPFQTNCWLAVDRDANEAVLFDAGLEPATLIAGVRESGAVLREIVLTHGHIDHVGGLAAFKRAFNVPVRMHADDAPMLQGVPMQARMFGVQAEQPPQPDGWLADGDVVAVGNHRFQVLHVPGHSPGSIALWSEADGVCMVGDLIFFGSVGRTDLPGGDFDILERSIRERIYPLPPATQLLPGHMQPTTVAREREHNPFVRP